MDVRTEERRDRAAVRRLHLDAFGEHGQVVADLVDDLRDQITPDNGLSLVGQRQGIGAALVRAGLQVMGQRSVPVVFVEGDPGYYSRLGFTPGAPQGFRKPSLRIPDPAFQALRLPSHETWMTGSLVYPETFWRHDAVGLRDSGPDR